MNLFCLLGDKKVLTKQSHEKDKLSTFFMRTKKCSLKLDKNTKGVFLLGGDNLCNEHRHWIRFRWTMLGTYFWLCMCILEFPLVNKRIEINHEKIMHIFYICIALRVSSSIKIPLTVVVAGSDQVFKQRDLLKSLILLSSSKTL